MRFNFYIALRYLFSKKSRNIVNIISGISGVTVCIVTAALVILLSAFNGLESLVLSLFNSFDPDIKITAAEGKSFERDSSQTLILRALPGVSNLSEVIEENALFVYGERQYIGVLKGVDNQFIGMTGLDTMMYEGEALIFDSMMLPKPITDSTSGETYDRIDREYAIIGSVVASSLGIDLASNRSLDVYFPKRGSKIDLFEPFKSRGISPAGVFGIQQDFDSKYVIVPIDFAADVLSIDDKITAWEADINPGIDPESVKHEMQKILGPGYIIKTRFEQHELLYKVMKTERRAVFMILTFILIIASFNIIGALTMLMVEKRKDSMVLWSLGLTEKNIRRIYLLQGILITLSGCIVGLILGAAVCYLQKWLGFVKINSGVDAPSYPVQIYGMDFLIIFCTVIFVGGMASLLRASTLKINKSDYFNLLK